MKKLLLIIALAAGICIFHVEGALAARTSETPVLFYKQMGDVGRVFFSPNGTVLMALSYSLDRVTVFSVDREELFSVEANQSAIVRCAALDPKGELVAAGFAELLGASPKGWLTVYGISNGAELWHISRTDARGAEKLAFSNNGRYLAALWICEEAEGNRRAVVALYSREGGFLWEEAISEEESLIRGALAVTEEGIVAAAEDRLVFLDFNGSQLWMREMPFSIEGITASSKGLIVVAGHSGFCLLNKDGELLWSKHFGAPIFSVDISRNGEFIVVGGWKGAKAYTAMGEELWSYQHGEDCITPAAISSEGYAIVVDNSKYPVRALLISCESVILWEEELPNTGVGGCVDITEDGSLAAVGGSWGLYLLKGKGYMEAAKPLPEKPPLTITPSHEEPLLWTLNCTNLLRAVHITEKGEVLAVTEGWIHLISGNGTPLWSKPFGPPLEAAVSPNGSYIAAATGRQVALLDKKGEEQWMQVLEKKVEALTFMDERIAAVALGKLYILNLNGKIEVRTDLELPSTPQKPIYSEIWRVVAAGSEESLVIAFSGVQSAVTLVDESGAVRWTLKLSRPVMSLALVDDTMLLGLGNGTLVALSANEGEQLWKVPLGEAPLLSIAANSEGLVVAVSKEGVIYGVKTGNILWKYPEKSEKYEHYMQALISKDGQRIAAAGSHLIILTSQGQQLWKQKLPEAEKPAEKLLAATPDLDIVAVITSKNTIHSLPTTPETFTGWLIAAICIAALAAVTALKMRRR